MSANAEKIAAVQWLTLFLVALQSLFGLIIYATHQGPKAVLEQGKLEAELHVARERVVSVHCHVLPDGDIITDGDETFVVTPVTVCVVNDGQSAFDIEEIAFRVFSAPIGTVMRTGEVDAPMSGPAVNSLRLAGYTVERKTRIGIIDIASINWREVEELRTVRTPANCTVLKGQSRMETFHLAIPEALIREPFKVAVTVRSNSNDIAEQTWMGFTNRYFCAPAEAPPGIGAEDFSAAAQATSAGTAFPVE